MYLPVSVMRCLVAVTTKPLFDPLMPVPLKRFLLNQSSVLHQSLSDVQVRQSQLADLVVEWHIPDDCRKPRVLLYLHGGKYLFGSPGSHRELVSHLAREAQCRAVAVDYRLAPEHPWPAALEDAFAVYMALLEQGIDPENIVVAGDSAGGGLSAALAVYIRQQQKPLPAGLFLISPWADMSCSSHTHDKGEVSDPMLSSRGLRAAARQYLAGAEESSPLASPVFADLSQLPPFLIHVGSDEVLLGDSLMLRDRLLESGGEVQLKVWQGLWHVFHHQVSMLKPASTAIKEAAAFCRQQFAV